ncbi:quinon protein alcohol dehydrogenase-like superfamily [Baffinella frigidus]|nr:quinon protein alcohol dehydrogenase-like superfamily [Cryptophyta sp. CCMP2293]
MEFRKVHTYASAPPTERSQRPLPQDARPGVGKTTGLTCMIGHNAKHMMFVGHSSGAIYAWRRSKNLASALADGSAHNGEHVLPAGGFEILKNPKMMHSGAVTAIKIQPSTELLYSGGADRCIKVWDVFNSERSPACVHSFRAHGGSVTCIEFGRVGPSPGFLFTGVELKTWPTSLAFSTTRMNQEARSVRGELEHWESNHVNSGHKLAVTNMTVNQTDGVLFSLSNDATFKVWELGSGQVRKSIANENRARFLHACLDLHNQNLLMVDAAGWVHVWSWVTERLIFSERICDHAGQIFAVACNNDGSEVLLQRANQIDSYLVTRGSVHVALRGHEGPLLGVGFLAPGKDEIYADREDIDDMLYSVALDNTLRSWDPISMQCSNVLPEPRSTEMSAFGLIKKLHVVLTGNDDGSLCVWSLDNGQHSINKGHQNTISALCTAWTGRDEHDQWGRDLVFTCGFEGELLQWEMTTVQRKDNVGTGRKCNLVGRTKAHRAEILCCVFVPPQMNATRYPEGLVVTAGNDLTIKKWSVSDRAELELAGHMQLSTPDGEVSMECHSDAITCLAVDANFLFTGSDDASIRIWDVQGSFLITTLDAKAGGHSDAVKLLLILPKEGYLVSLGVDMILKVWDYTQATVVWETLHERGVITCMCYDERSGRLVCGSEDHTIVTVDLPDFQALRVAREQQEAEEEDAAAAAQGVRRSGGATTHAGLLA